MTRRSPRAVVIGASAGSVQALSVLLPALPKEYPLAILIVIHVPPDKQSMLAEVFRPKCRINVKEAEDKEELQGGTAYFAPPDYHMLVESDYTVALSSDEPVLFSRPSIDVLFESAADAFEDQLIGIILTGANSDGALGLKAVADAGGVAIVQEPGEAYAAAMPVAAIKECPKATILGLEEITRFLQKGMPV